MKLIFATLAATLAFASSSDAQTPPPPPEGPIHVVAYVETQATAVASSIKHLKAYRDATLKEAGAVAVALYEETSRPNRFLVDEVWRDFAAWDAHAKAGVLASAIRNEQLAPPDVRAHTQWSVALASVPSASGFYVYTHIDVAPPQLARLQEILKPYLEQSRGDAGAIRFDLLQGLLPRRNHQTLAEAWKSEADFRTHQASPHARAFRDELGPLLGALYDQRFYRRLP